jgi:phosphopantothenate---cysteine ligase (CTP)
MKAIITCGPSYEPVDQVRRLTNLSTGALGVTLAERLSAAGWEVVCLKGTGATHPDPREVAHLEHFTTNDDLAARLERWSRLGSWTAVLHAAALCDYRVGLVEDLSGRVRREGKVPSEAGELVLRLVPARKVIGSLREWFSQAWLVGWKFEVEGDRQAAVDRGWRQLTVNRTDACVVNGPACGAGYVVCLRGGHQVAGGDRQALVGWLADELSRRSGGSAAR